MPYMFILRNMSVLRFRYFVFSLALGYWLYQFTTTNYDTVGWQFRHLTFWGLTGAVYVAWLMLSLSRKGLPPPIILLSHRWRYSMPWLCFYTGSCILLIHHW